MEKELKTKLVLKDSKGRFIAGNVSNPEGRKISKRQLLWSQVFTDDVSLELLHQAKQAAIDGDESIRDFVLSRLAVAKPKTDLEEQKLELEIEILRKGAIEFDERLKETQRSVDALHKLIGVIKDDERYKPVVEQVLSTLVGGQSEEESIEESNEEER